MKDFQTGDMYNASRKYATFAPSKQKSILASTQKLCSAILGAKGPLQIAMIYPAAVGLHVE